MNEFLHNALLGGLAGALACGAINITIRLATQFLISQRRRRRPARRTWTDAEVLGDGLRHRQAEEIPHA